MGLEGSRHAVLNFGQVVDRLAHLREERRNRDEAGANHPYPASDEHDGNRQGPLDAVSLQPADRRVERSHEDQGDHDDHQDRQQEIEQPDSTHRQRDGEDRPVGDLDPVNHRGAANARVRFVLRIGHEARGRL